MPTYNDPSFCHLPDVVTCASNLSGDQGQPGLFSETLTQTTKRRKKNSGPYLRSREGSVASYFSLEATKAMWYRSVSVQPIRHEASRMPSPNFRTVSIDFTYSGYTPRRVTTRSICLVFTGQFSGEPPSLFSNLMFPTPAGTRGPRFPHPPYTWSFQPVDVLSVCCAAGNPSQELFCAKLSSLSYALTL